MRAITQASLVLVASLFAYQARAGDITGRVLLKGTPPPERRIDVTSDPALADKFPKGLTTRRYQVSRDGGLQNVLVYLVGDFRGAKLEMPRTPAVLDHVDGLFQPYVMGVQIGQPLQLRCSDHTICGFTAEAKQNQDFVISPMSGVVSRAFTTSEVAVRFRDDVHPWNFAFVGVFAHPFFAVTDQAGRFTIPGVPAGRYTLEIFHPRTGKSAREVMVQNANTVADFTVIAK